MPDAPLFTAMFSFVGMFYGFVVPVLIVQFLALLFIPSLMYKDAKPMEVAQAIYCFVMQALGILLMTAGGLPTIISVLADRKLEGATYFSLLIIFAAGGALFLWHDNLVRSIPSRSRTVPATIFHYLYKTIGHTLVFLWSLSFLVTILSGIPDQAGWWIMPIVMVGYGSLFIWCTRPEQATIIPPFESVPMQTPKPAKAARKTTKRTSATKKKKTPAKKRKKS